MANEVRSGMSAELLPGAAWRKSSYSGAMGNCVEVAALVSGEVAVRNSRHPGGPALIFTHSEWAAFLGGIAQGEFDLRGTDRADPRTR